MKKTFKLVNEVHGTTAQVRLNLEGETVLKCHTVNRIRKIMCPVEGECACKKDELFGKGDFASAVWNGATGEIVVTRVPAPVTPPAPTAPVYTADMEAAPAPVEAAPAPVADAQPV